jgi:hypothetical protein
MSGNVYSKEDCEALIAIAVAGARLGLEICSDCPPPNWSTDVTRCVKCPRLFKSGSAPTHEELMAAVRLADEAMTYMARLLNEPSPLAEASTDETYTAFQAVRYCISKFEKSKDSAPQNRGSNINKGCDCKGATDLSEHQPWCASLPNNQS